MLIIYSYVNIKYEKKINNIINKYFLAFEKKKISILESLFEEKINLQDWNNCISGRTKVITFNKKIFSKFENIKIRIKNIFFSKNFLTAACMIDVVLNKSKIKVLNFLKKIEDFKISRIIYTNIAKDGLKKGIDRLGSKRIIKNTDIPVVISGGVSSLEDVKIAKNLGSSGLIIGRAIYDKVIDIDKLFKII